ncbi:MAG: DUF308 domain-containing protein [Bacilli bacterium]|nr:DUF308 domain-containing protein [Bacilli bacterium]
MRKSRGAIKFLESQFNIYMNTNIILALIMIILGLILYAVPSAAIKTVSWLIGIFFCVQGITAVISYIKKDRISLLTFNLIYGIISFLIGVFVISNPFALANIITIGLGIWLIVSGGLKINYGIRLKNIKEASWTITLVVGIISILFGLMVIINPFAKLFLVEVVGVFLLVYGIIDLTNIILLKKRAKDFIKIFK